MRVYEILNLGKSIAERFNIICIICLLICSGFISSCRKSDYYLENSQMIRDTGTGTGNVTWKHDKIYIIDGRVFINDGQTLTIEAGTVIKGTVSSRNHASALVVARGGRIIAQGKPDKPIIFTSVLDDPVGSLSFSYKGLWGGVIILGNAPLNVEGGEAFIEGIPLSEPRGVYGGYNDDDNSGVFSYVSIRHAGIDIGEENEINGLTLGGVGRKTKIDHIEVISSNDDGFEFFGGNVSCKNLIAAFCKDDAFDFDEGYYGKLQFILAVKDINEGDCLAEHSDYLFPVKQLNLPTIYNATFIGNRSQTDAPLIRFFGNGGGIYRNSIFLNNYKGIVIEYKEERSSSYDQFINGNIVIENNLFFNVAGNNPDSIFSVEYSNKTAVNNIHISSDYFFNSQNKIANMGINVNSFPYLVFPESVIFDNMAVYDSPWFDEVSYMGAFGSNNWMEGWSLLWKKNIIN